MIADAALLYLVDAWWKTPHNPRRQAQSSLRSFLFSQKGILVEASVAWPWLPRKNY